MVVIKRKKIKLGTSKKKKEDTIDVAEMQNKQLELFRVKQQLKMLGGRENELKNELGTYMEKTFKPDVSGHYLFTTVDSEGNKIHLQRQARKKISLNEERAKAYLKKKKLLSKVVTKKEVIASDVTDEQVLDVLAEHAPHLLEKIEVMDESAIEQLVTSEVIPMDEFEGLCDININYAMAYIDDKKLQQEE